MLARPPVAPRQGEYKGNDRVTLIPARCHHRPRVQVGTLADWQVVVEQRLVG